MQSTFFTLIKPPIRSFYAPFEEKKAQKAHGYCVLLFVLTLLTLNLSFNATAQERSTAGFAGIGRAATPAEIKAWDIDIRGDFTGLPPGEGSVAKGMAVWEAKCASCHGVFGESNEVFPPIVGGTTKKDMETGRVTALVTNTETQRTTLMKLARLSSLWDYINRAMPWNAPKTLTTEEVYAVTAYILHLGDIVPADFVLSDQNIRDVQNKLPNRNGLTQEHGLWSVRGKPDVQGTLCMKNCAANVNVASSIPDYARDAHGNLAEQKRLIGGTRGAQTSQPQAAPTAARAQTAVAGEEGAKLAGKFACTTCHAINAKLVGPSWQQITEKYAQRPDAVTYLAGKIRQGGQGVWGAARMPAQTAVSEADAQTLARWLARSK
jgi:S-disulfanyl-L-cysteine oxidoreductase SoxD